jgi:hypothetical protein
MNDEDKPTIEVYVVVQCKNVEVWFILKERLLSRICAEYPMDNRYTFRTDDNLKTTRIDPVDWPDTIIHDFDFNRCQIEYDPPQCDGEDDENYEDRCTKIYKIQ